MTRSADERRAALSRGASAEEQVARVLQERGWRVLDRNWRGRGGELDIVVADGGRLRFVEVKLRDPDDPVGIEAIGTNKQRRLIRAAEAWLAQYDDIVDEAAFMVAYVEAGTITWIDDAFDAP